MILSLLSDHGIQPKRVSSNKGGEYHSPCPRCGGTDRFHAWPEQYQGQGSFWCRSCDLGGDCIKFLMEYNGLNFRQAAERTGKQLDDRQQGGYTTPRPPRRPQQQQRQPDARECLPPLDAWQQQARELVDKAHAALLENSELLAYLAGRGLPIEAVQRYQLGWIGSTDKDCTFSSRKKWGLEPKQGNKKPDALWLPRGIVIPNEFDDRIDSIRIRRPKADRVPPLQDLSYHVVPGGGTAPMLLWNGQPAIVVVEAQLDGMLCHHLAGDIVGVLALGNDSARPDARSLAALQQAKIILVALDFDANNAGGKSWARWQRDYDHAVRWPVSQGKDPGEAFEAGADIRQWLQAGLPAAYRQPKPPARISQAAPSAPAKPERQAWKLRTSTGRELCIVADPRDRQRYHQQTGLVTLAEADLEQFKAMDQVAREKSLDALQVFGGEVDYSGQITDQSAAWLCDIKQQQVNHLPAAGKMVAKTEPEPEPTQEELSL